MIEREDLVRQGCRSPCILKKERRRYLGADWLSDRFRRDKHTWQLAHSHVQAVLGSVHSFQLLKVFPSIADIDEGGCRGCSETDAI